MTPKVLVRAAGVLLLTLALPVASLHAQQVPVAPGTRVRVSATPLVSPLVANFLEQRADTLVFIEDGTGRGVWSFTLAQVQKLETTGGDAALNRPYILRGAAIGGGTGLLVGLMFAATAKPADTERTYNRPLTGLIGAAAGAGVGVLIGSRFKRERWINVPLAGRVALVPDLSGGVRLTASFR